jgi:pimeloyl-ACP methyl ester carboxylesterase
LTFAQSYSAPTGKEPDMTALPNIVLVHGAWADGSSWSAVIEHLQADGYRVTAPQFSMTRLADDVARLRQVLARQQGPTVVAGHSYGGQLITASAPTPPTWLAWSPSRSPDQSSSVSMS